MNPVPVFPSVADAMAAVRAGLRFVTAARASVLSAFTSGQGYSEDAQYSPRAWP